MFSLFRFVFFLLYNNFIPISLYVSIELVNVGQGFLISADEQLYQPDLDVPCAVRSSNLVQEIGMVSNIFSDKTGTLTRNEMKFIKYVINGTLYDLVPPEAEDSATSDKATEQLITKFKDKNGADKGAFYDFFRCLTTCHTVIREKDGTYRAESPDELALVEGVGKYRCVLNERGTKEMLVEMFGEKQTYEVMAVNPFNADRKRMSILLRDTVSKEYFLMCKGADNIMMPLCAMDQTERQGLETSLLDLANLGLRTLCIAHKRLSEKEATDWMAEFKAANISTDNREDKIAAAGANIEQEMKLLGITAIEDRLQDQVPEVIADLAKAGIILWMLTGDKLETAINIGRSCNLVLNDSTLLMIHKVTSKEHFKTMLTGEHEKCIQATTNNLVLVMDGPSFHYFDEDDPESRAMLLKIGASCRSVIACRLTPTQKKDLVALVKADTVPKVTTLSIGDGANDVPMILEGDVGVGIYGKEGRQAANSADFAIGEFKFLRRLLLVHGRWNYIRQSKVFLYSMHKNMVLTLTLFWFSYYTAVSGTSLYESWVYASYNIVLGLPIIFYGIMDRDITDTFSLAHPQVGKITVIFLTSVLYHLYSFSIKIYFEYRLMLLDVRISY